MFDCVLDAHFWTLTALLRIIAALSSFHRTSLMNTPDVNYWYLPVFISLNSTYQWTTVCCDGSKGARFFEGFCKKDFDALVWEEVFGKARWSEELAQKEIDDITTRCPKDLSL